MAVMGGVGEGGKWRQLYLNNNKKKEREGERKKINILSLLILAITLLGGFNYLNSYS